MAIIFENSNETSLAHSVFTTTTTTNGILFLGALHLEKMESFYNYFLKNSSFDKNGLTKRLAILLTNIPKEGCFRVKIMLYPKFDYLKRRIKNPDMLVWAIEYREYHLLSLEKLVSQPLLCHHPRKIFFKETRVGNLIEKIEIYNERFSKLRSLPEKSELIATKENKVLSFSSSNLILFRQGSFYTPRTHLKSATKTIWNDLVKLDDCDLAKDEISLESDILISSNSVNPVQVVSKRNDVNMIKLLLEKWLKTSSQYEYVI